MASRFLTRTTNVAGNDKGTSLVQDRIRYVILVVASEWAKKA